MKIFIRSLVIASVVSCAAFSLVGCSSGEKSTTASSSKATTTTQPDASTGVNPEMIEREKKNAETAAKANAAGSAEFKKYVEGGGK